VVGFTLTGVVRAALVTNVEGFERFIAWTIRQRTAGSYACFAVTVKGFDTAVEIGQMRELAPASAPPSGAGCRLTVWGTSVFHDGGPRKSFSKNGNISIRDVDDFRHRLSFHRHLGGHDQSLACSHFAVTRVHRDFRSPVCLYLQEDTKGPIVSF